MRQAIWTGLAALALTGCSFSTADTGSAPAAVLAAPELVTPPERDPSELQVLFWDDATREARFRDMESWFAGHEVPAASATRKLEQGEPLDLASAAALREYMAKSNAAGALVLEDGKVRFEEYALDFGPDQRWTSFSVAKSFTSTLMGAAVADGFIGSMDDPVTMYIPELEGSAYEGVSVRQLATMTSGVAWNEDYSDPASDVAQMNRFVVEYGPDAMIAQMKGLKRAVPAGERFLYSTGETNLIGMLVENAVGLPLAVYAQRKIVEPAGFRGGLFWMVDPRGGNVGGCCLSLRLSDYARFGQFVLEGGEGVVPPGWFAQASAPLVSLNANGFGYGYQWWTYPSGKYGAQGIFGQAITIVPDKKMVFVIVSNWPIASSADLRGEWITLTQAIAGAH